MSPDNKIRLNLEGESEQELLDLKSDIDLDITTIRIQLSDAKAKVVTDGSYSDPEWWRKANAALKIKGRQSQQIQNELSLMRRKKQEIKAQQFERRFIDIAKKELSEEVFQKILNQAREIE